MGPGPGTLADQYVFYLVNKPNRLVSLFASGTPGLPGSRFAVLHLIDVINQSAM
jgi:hypothetical protein